MNELVKGVFGEFEIYAHDAGIRLGLKQFGAYQGSNLSMLLDALPKGGRVLDLGAHVGTFCVAIAKKVGSHGKVIAVEGTPSTFAILERNITSNEVAWATALNRVVSDKDATYKVDLGRGRQRI